MSSTTQETKPVHTIVLDSSPLLLNTPTLSTLLSQCEQLVSTPNVISEIKDVEARRRVETTYIPFLALRIPKPESVRFVKDFARRTGDAAVLSEVDIELIALAYDVEIERNNGDWRLRKAPGQKILNGKPPVKSEPVQHTRHTEHDPSESPSQELSQQVGKLNLDNGKVTVEDETDHRDTTSKEEQNSGNTESETATISPMDASEEIESDSDGWITPTNLKKKQAEDEGSALSSKSEPKMLQVATMTGDFALQNVLLQINLNLLSPKTCKRIQNIRTTVLRCHACFATNKKMDKQFCDRCGKPTLTRVTCTTNDKGEVKLHLKKNMQWNNKGNVYSIPKPTGSHSNQKWQGRHDRGGKGGWGNGLILAEDQKEYVRAVTVQQRKKEKDLMDEDSLPSLLTGDRQGDSGKIRVGGGRNINSRKR